MPLDASLCGRCGLAVRPTCANCGEPLLPGRDSCPRCREPVQAPLASTTPAAIATEVGTAVAPPAVRTRRRGGFARFVFIAVVAGLLVAVGLIALELVVQRPAPPSGLVSRSYPALGFAISEPEGWDVSQVDLPHPVVEFFEPDIDTVAGKRGFRVALEPSTLQQARKAVADDIRRGGRNYKLVGVSAGLAADGQPAFRYEYSSDETYVQQWWVTRPGGTFRIEFWGPSSDRDDTDALAARVLDTFRIIR